MRTTKEERKAARRHIIGNQSETSLVEDNVYNLIIKKAYNNPNKEYSFFFNRSIVDFGVPSRSYRIYNFRKEYVDFIMNRCRVSQTIANELLSLVNGENIRTNALLLDVGRTRNGKLEIALELNKGQHYYIPDDIVAKRQFARACFCDMIKGMELEKICDYHIIDCRILTEFGLGSDESIRQDKIINNFINNI